MTSGYTFSTIKFVPRSLCEEPVNIGVLLHDPATGLLHKKITRNWGEVRRRTGIASLPDLGSIASTEPVKASADRLLSLSRHAIPSNIIITKPRPLVDFPTTQEALEWVFRSQISVPDRGRTAEGRAWRVDAALTRIIIEARFPSECHKQGYEFPGMDVPVRFPHVFVSDNRPVAAVFAVSLGRSGVLGYIKQRLYEILSVREQGWDRMDFTMFTGGGRGASDDRDIRDGMKLAKKRKVEVVDEDGVEDALGRIRQRVAAR